MSKTRNLAAYLAWIVALVTILMPPAVATAGLELVARTGDAIFASVEDEPPVLAVASARIDGHGGRG